MKVIEKFDFEKQNMTKITNTHFLRIDHRVVSLSMAITGLTETISVLKNQLNEIHWYDGEWFLEESEPIYGLAFIAFQNYINGSIKDFADSLNEKETYYKLEKNLPEGNKSRIELIIALANYAKHKDEGIPHRGTKEILDHFNLNYEDVNYLDKSPIFQGLNLFSEGWDLFTLKTLVTDWREYMWARFD
ncbi:hypothetical protein [Aequorivita sublithincola]|nr:hypothetical protein [Aequorivita sublithincola]